MLGGLSQSFIDYLFDDTIFETFLRLWILDLSGCGKEIVMVERLWLFFLRAGIPVLRLFELFCQCIPHEFDASTVAKLGEMFSHEIPKISDLPELINDLQGYSL